jgi:dTDP-4-amino-4,6-dideoxygalactose transaminase
VEGTRKLFVSDLGVGWRAAEGNGALGDLGWHLINDALGLTNTDTVPHMKSVNLLSVRKHQAYKCEDSACIHFNTSTTDGNNESHEVLFNLNVSRVGHEKINQLIFTGEDGVLVVRGNEITLQLLLSSGVHRSQSTIPVESEVQRMLHAFRDEIISPEPTVQYLLFQKLDMNITATLEAAYSSHKYSLLTPPRSILSESEEFTSISRVSSASYFSDISLSLGAQTQWPKISADVEEAVNTQLHTDISIYGSGGVFTDFEYEFQEFHGVPNSFSLLHNSGSNALQSLYFAAQFMPGDEVIFPVYTFHATASPAMHFGIRPIFCDCDETGNISPQAIKQVITPRTKAVVITHMWGIPCDLPAILSILAEHPSLLLLEDCSHAHAASINGKMVGTFGDGAAWSLQGQKIVTGGEGGIVLTKHADFHYRQLLWGHYNKRCKTEIPNNHPLQKYSLTGTGNKHRAHPLAVALALTQLRKLNSFHKVKSYFAKKMMTELAEIRFLAMPVVSLTNDSTSHPAWYAMVLQFVKEKAPDNMTRDNFVAKLHEAGLEEIDTPKSTGLLHDEPLFTNPKEVLPHGILAMRLSPKHLERSLLARRDSTIMQLSCLYSPIWRMKRELIIISSRSRM